ncbi:MAG TPA: DUF4307 domain-containing protein [Cellulomonas sp.]
MPAPDALPAPTAPGADPDPGTGTGTGTGTGQFSGPGIDAEVPADRYGRAPGPRRRLLARIGLGAVAATGVAVVLWLALGAAATPVRWEEVGFDVQGSTAVEMTFTVTKDADATAVCQVQALSAQYAEVGVQSVTVGPAGTATQQVTTTIPTAELAVTAVVSTCELG